MASFELLVFSSRSLREFVAETGVLTAPQGIQAGGKTRNDVRFSASSTYQQVIGRMFPPPSDYRSWYYYEVVKGRLDGVGFKELMVEPGSINL